MILALSTLYFFTFSPQQANKMFCYLTQNYFLFGFVVIKLSSVSDAMI